ncbi:MAG: TVP38/TMEM64 family protein [Opitutales bacterium]|nr:TVP38/TMEM64 family protein [Opitutales bacterium]
METPKETSKKSNGLRLAALLLVIVVLIVASQVLPVGEWFTTFNEWVAELGWVGVLVFMGVYLLATVLLLPGAPLTIGSGFIFGLGWGFVAVSVGATAGAALAFLIGRFLAREKIEEATKDKPKFQSVDRAIGNRGAKLIFLLRLSPLIPFNLSNYFYGLTAVRFWPYTLASFFGMMPGILVYVYIGTLGRAGVEAAAGGAERARSPLEYVLLVAGLIATVAVTVWVSRIASAAIKETEVAKEEKEYQEVFPEKKSDGVPFTDGGTESSGEK